jgi:hypothetical protein
MEKALDVDIWSVNGGEPGQAGYELSYRIVQSTVERRLSELPINQITATKECGC